jgi:bacterioferritin (cytochrome b1)
MLKKKKGSTFWRGIYNLPLNKVHQLKQDLKKELLIFSDHALYMIMRQGPGLEKVAKNNSRSYMERTKARKRKIEEVFLRYGLTPDEVWD